MWGRTMNVYVSLHGGVGEPQAVAINAGDTVSQLKAAAAVALGVPEECRMRLEHNDNELEDDVPIAETQVDEGEELILTMVSNPAWKDQIQLGGTGLSERYCTQLFGVSFPESRGLQINMMPFIMATPFEATYLPEECRQYYEECITRLLSVLSEEMGKVCYISIDERDVAASESHRRGGVHTENPGPMPMLRATVGDKGAGSPEPLEWFHHWGMSRGHLDGGIYMASTVRASCQAWNCQIIPHPETGAELMGARGDIEHLRDLLPEGQPLAAHWVYWMTDRTPHESLPLEEDCHRQWFRLVTSEVSFWHRDHSTPNPNGVLPDPEKTKIVVGNKFNPAELRIVPPEEANLPDPTKQDEEEVPL